MRAAHWFDLRNRSRMTFVSFCVQIAPRRGERMRPGVWAFSVLLRRACGHPSGFVRAQVRATPSCQCPSPLSNPPEQRTPMRRRRRCARAGTAEVPPAFVYVRASAAHRCRAQSRVWVQGRHLAHALRPSCGCSGMPLALDSATKRCALGLCALPDAPVDVGCVASTSRRVSRCSRREIGRGLGRHGGNGSRTAPPPPVGLSRSAGTVHA